MANELNKLVNIARGVSMTSEQKESQRRSFAYGNTKIENEQITRRTINNAAERLSQKKD